MAGVTLPATSPSPKQPPPPGSPRTRTRRKTSASGPGTPSAAPQATGAPGDAVDRTRPWRELVGAASHADLKLAMAASGAVLSVFTVGHMAGNMQVYLGRERYNEYAELIRSLGSPVLPRSTALWVVRAGLLASTAAHVAAGTELSLRALRAEGRTVADLARDTAWRAGAATHRVGLYRDRLTGRSALPRIGAAPRRRPRGRRRSLPQIIARSMRSTGAVLGLFTAYHVADLTVGARPAASRDHAHGDAHGNLVASLSRPPVAVFYTASMAALAGHMIHGVRTAAMDIGFTVSARRVQRVDTAAKTVGAVVALGNMSIPVAVLSKVVR